MATSIIYGTIHKDGGTASGKGFTCTRIDNGTYKIFFSPPFKTIPAITGSQTGFSDNKQNPLDNIVFPKLHRDYCTAKTADSSGTATDRQFSFIAIGEQ